MSTTVKEFIILDRYRLVRPYGFWTVSETFSFVLSLPSNAKIVTAKLRYYVHCEKGVDVNIAKILMSNKGNPNDMKVVYVNYYLRVCEEQSGEQDVTAFIVPLTGPDIATNYFQIVSGNSFSVLVDNETVFSLTLVVEYEGQEPSATYVKTSTTTSPSFSMVQGFIMFIELLPIMIILWLILSLISTIRELIPRRKD